MAGCPSCSAETRREAFLAIGAIGECSRDAGAALLAQGALQSVRADMAAAYTGAADNSPAVKAAVAPFPSPGGAGRTIWGQGGAEPPPGRGGARGPPAPAGGGGAKGPGFGPGSERDVNQRLKDRQPSGSMGDMSSYTEEENREVAYAALVALAGLAQSIDFSMQDQHGPLTALLLRCIEVDASVPVVTAAARAIQSLLTLGKGRASLIMHDTSSTTFVDPRFLRLTASCDMASVIHCPFSVIRPVLNPKH